MLTAGVQTIWHARSTTDCFVPLLDIICDEVSLAAALAAEREMDNMSVDFDF